MVYVAKVYPPWQAYILEYLTAKFDANDGKLPDNKAMSADLMVRSARRFPPLFTPQQAVDLVLATAQNNATQPLPLPS